MTTTPIQKVILVSTPIWNPINLPVHRKLHLLRNIQLRLDLNCPIKWPVIHLWVGWGHLDHLVIWPRNLNIIRRKLKNHWLVLAGRLSNQLLTLQAFTVLLSLRRCKETKKNKKFWINYSNYSVFKNSMRKN